MDASQTTPEVEVNNTEDVQDAPQEEVQEEAQEPTVAEILNKVEDKTVPLNTFLETKKEKKALEKELSNLQAQIKAGATKGEANASLKEIAEKYDVDVNFITELSSAIYAQAKDDVEEKLNSKLQHLEAREREEKINKAFNDHYEKVIQEMPEYNKVINKNVIKSLSLLPENSKKTFQQIIEETYGNSVTGKRTMETSTPRGGKDQGIDYSKVNDPEYFQKIMDNPELKKKYNDGLLSRINL
jgi:hypothetical protein